MQSIVTSKGIVKKKITRIWGLIFCLLLFACCAGAQSVTLSLRDVPIEKAFTSIESQTAFRFIYSTETIKNAKPVTVQLANAQLRDVLSKIFSGQPLSYSIEDKQIIVKANEKKQEPDHIGLAGRVKDETGNPLEGVNVSVKNTDIATVTDYNGAFYLSDLRGDEVLIFSMVGFNRLEVPVMNRKKVQVTMQVAVSILDETIVKGYYNTTRRLNTGSVDKITSEEINRQPVSNVLAAMEGRVPGLLITQGNGLPGSNFSVLIRGQNSIQSGTSPLYIIDGVPFLNDADVLTQRSGINASNPLNTINPSDIESIEVLKDADATAIYGSRGANGVILITTRKGKEGTTSLDVNYYQGFGKVTHVMQYMNTSQYLAMRHEAFANDNVIPTSSKAYDFLAWDSTRYADLAKLLIGNTSSSTNINLRLSGGASGTHFTLGTGYSRESTVFPGNTSDKRATVDLSLTHSLPDKKFSISLATSYSNEGSNLFNLDLTQFINLPPTIPALYDTSGKLNWSSGGFSFYNPLAVTLQTYKVNTGRLTANLNLDYFLSSKIDLKTSLGYNELHTDENTRFPIASQDPAFAPIGSAFIGTTHFRNWIIEPQAEYHSSLGKKGKFQFLLGASLQENRADRVAVTASGYTNDELLGSVAAAPGIETENSDVLYRYNAVFARANYSLNDEFILNLTGRRDGSSRFGPGRQFANFGAVGGAWIFTKQKWADHLPLLSFGKLRGSYGITGNDLIGDYQFLDAYQVTIYPYQDDPSLIPQKLFNPNYSWEQIRKLDLALELAFWKEKVNLEIDYFKNKSRNQIINYSLPGQVGFPTVLQNIPGIVQNGGVEVQLGARIIKNDLVNWHSSVQLTVSKNKLVAFPGLESSSYGTAYTLGKPLNSRRGYLFAGVNPQTGLYEFWDSNKQTTSSPTLSDYTYLGSSDPKFYGGWKNDLSVKNWQLNFLFEFRKQKGADPVFSRTDRPGTIKNQPVLVLERWQQSGDIARYQKFTQASGAPASAAVNASRSDAYFTDASFIRLKNLSLSYMFPSSVLERIKMQSARFFVEGQNLLLLTKYKGNDPETQNPMVLPPLRVLAVGLQLSF